MGFFHKTLLLFTLILTSQAKAITPESGFWWNPDEPGSGYTIEIQDNFLFIIAYVYDGGGNPIWYTAGTTMENNRLFDSVLDFTYNGPCIDCSYSQPITILGDRGPITINFLTETTATLQFGGAVKHIERFNFLLGDETTRMLGVWQTVIDTSGPDIEFPYIGDVLMFDITTVIDGIDYAEGCRPDNSLTSFCSNFALNNHYATAEYDYINNELVIVVEDDPFNDFYYYVDLGLDQFDGELEVVPISGPHNNIYYPVRGFRTASRSFVETGVGPNLVAETDNEDRKEIVGISKRIINNKVKPLSSFDEAKQAKILRRQAIVKKIKEKMKSSDRTNK